MKIYRKIRRAIKDIVIFTDESEGLYNFVYSYGVMAARENVGNVIALFDADTETQLERYINLLDKTFHVYTDTMADREYDVAQGCWYCTYVVRYPFSKENMSGQFDGQNARPLF